MRTILIFFLAIVFVFFAEDSAFARKSSSSSSKSRNISGFMSKKCKTAACYKKHPDGDYSIPLRKKQ